MKPPIPGYQFPCTAVIMTTTTHLKNSNRCSQHLYMLMKRQSYIPVTCQVQNNSLFWIQLVWTKLYWNQISQFVNLSANLAMHKRTHRSLPASLDSANQFALMMGQPLGVDSSEHVASMPPFKYFVIRPWMPLASASSRMTGIGEPAVAFGRKRSLV